MQKKTNKLHYMFNVDLNLIIHQIIVYLNMYNRLSIFLLINYYLYKNNFFCLRKKS